MEDTLFRGNREPSLDQILAEPIVQMIMRRDGVDDQSIRRLMRKAAAMAGAAKLAFIQLTPLVAGPDGELLPASAGVLAQAAAPHWPRVFPGL